MADKKIDNGEPVASEAVDRHTDEHETPATDASTDDTKPVTADDSPEPKRRRLQASISVRTLLIVGVIAALVAGMSVMTWLYVGSESKLDEQARQQADAERAEQIALDYATNAAAMNFQEIPVWKGKLVEGTSPELGGRLSEAADQMEQILVPLQWESTARPLSAKVRSRVGSVYIVDAFVSVMTKTAQGPDPLQSTATYSVTIDSDNDWKITDVGGIGAAVEGR